LSPEKKLTTNGKTVAVSMKVNEDANDVVIYRSNSENFSGWTKVDDKIACKVITNLKLNCLEIILKHK
jgi:hypothetical protein